MTSSDFPPRPPALSPEGHQRREDILQQLVVHQARLQRRRQRRRRAGTAGLVVLAALVTVWLGRGLSPDPQPAPEQLAQPAQPRNATRVAVVGNRPNVVERYVVRRSQPQGATSLETLDDDELIDLMSQIDPQTIIARIGGQMHVVRPTDLRP